MLATAVAAQDEEPSSEVYFFWFIFILIALLLVFLLYKGVVIIQPYEQGLKIVLGKYSGRLNPGLNLVPPLITRVIRMDLRTQVFDVPQQEVITKDNSPTRVDAIIYIKIVDPEKAFFQVTNYKLATVALAQTTLRSTIGDMELDEILYNRTVINHQLRDTLDEATDPWGVKVEMVEIREVDPVGAVKAAMEEQTAAERERRAAILRADGVKRSAILEAEGAKRSRILQAEGIKQSKIVEAEGERLRQILVAQGEAQALRIMAVGAATLDQKALTVKSLNTLATMANGKATKIIFPFEVSKLIEGAAEYMGASRTVPDRPISDVAELERIVGPTHNILGEIPSPENIAAQLQSIEKKKEVESEEPMKLDEQVMTHELDLDASDTMSLERKPREDLGK
ncbi:MAG: SPFH/Band 7/PHB domain protein [Thermoplasmata archaeon]|nr:SPFH/Band 7/PHB domain protein [Thermoplasmata archaeon]